MAGTKAGGKKAAETNKKRYGKDYYSKLGHRGGTAEHYYPRGFEAMDREKHLEASAKGGRNSKRGKAKDEL